MHWFALVLVPPETDDVAGKVEELLRPFAPREEEVACSCQLGKEPLPCQLCNGGGTVVADTNTATRYDWMMIGGRFDGRVAGLPPERFERQRQILRYSLSKPYTLEEGRVLVRIRNNEEWQGALSRVYQELVEANTVRVAELPSDLWCSVLVTPDGCWHDHRFVGGDVGCTPEEYWARKCQDLLAAHQNCLAVGCDLHV